MGGLGMAVTGPARRSCVSFFFPRLMPRLCPSGVGEKAVYQEAVHSEVEKAVDATSYIYCPSQKARVKTIH